MTLYHFSITTQIVQWAGEPEPIPALYYDRNSKHSERGRCPCLFSHGNTALRASEFHNILFPTPSIFLSSRLLSFSSFQDYISFDLKTFMTDCAGLDSVTKLRRFIEDEHFTNWRRLEIMYLQEQFFEPLGFADRPGPESSAQERHCLEEI